VPTVNKNMLLVACCMGLFFACGDDEPVPQVPPGNARAVVGQQTADSIVPSEGQTELMREVFSYRGSGRDPFKSLLQSSDIRPLIEDLRVTSIAYDPRYPAASIAVLRDTIANQAYSVRVGDELGRLRVAEIHPGEVVMIVTEFGSERQAILRQRQTQERTP
jgi:hypothetical protein